MRKYNCVFMYLYVCIMYVRIWIHLSYAWGSENLEFTIIIAVSCSIFSIWRVIFEGLNFHELGS